MDFDDELESLKTDLNKFCCECLSPDPEWVSVNNGIFICIKCAGQHRAYGVNISFVRSLKLDLIEGDQIEMLKRGGNRKFLEFVQLYKLNHDEYVSSTKFITKASNFYRSLLRQAVETKKDFIVDESLFKRLSFKKGQQVMDNQKE